MLDITPGPVGGSGLILDRRVLRRHAEGVEAHRVEDVQPLHTQEPRQQIADRIVAQVPHMERPARIGEHFKAIELLFAVVDLYLKNLRVGPRFLPFRFNGGKIIRHLYLSFLDEEFSFIHHGIIYTRL